MSNYIRRSESTAALIDKTFLEGYDLEETVNAICCIPAADVRPVVHGHWVTVEEANAMGDYAAAYTCSVCGRCDWDCTESESFNYCPNCGAQMQEVTASE